MKNYNKNSKANMPTIVVVLGATGDLVSKKIAPALFNLHSANKLPKFFKVVGFSRNTLSNNDYRDFLSKIISKKINIKSKKKLQGFLKSVSYQRGFFENKGDYNNMAKALKQIDDKWGVCTNKLFYLAVHPQFYETIFNNLAKSGLTKSCSQEEGWTRVIVEKPFGRNLKTAKHLDELLGKLFKEEQIYRVDHYLAKDMIQNIIAFRFSNNLFEQIWNNNSIEKIEIRLWEKMGVEDRGAFYDGVGALRDIGQNHLLQILALIAMGRPDEISAGAIRLKRAQILKTLKKPSQKEIKNSSFRAQYDGYRRIKGVNSKSMTETYFKIAAFLEDSRFAGVPVILEGGKKIDRQVKEAVITFKHAGPCFLCVPGSHYKNKMIISLEPKEKISIQFWAKKPGLGFGIEERSFDFLLRGKKNMAQYVEEYEQLLLDCINGDQTLFVSTDEVKAMWRFIDPIISAWQKNLVPLKKYKANTNEPIKESNFIN